MFQKTDGTTVMQVRYINKMVGYTGLWMDVEIKKEKIEE